MHFHTNRLTSTFFAGGDMAETVDDDDQVSELEAARRRDEVVKRMLATPPQPRTAKPAKSSPKAPKDGRPS